MDTGTKAKNQGTILRYTATKLKNPGADLGTQRLNLSAQGPILGNKVPCFRWLVLVRVIGVG